MASNEVWTRTQRHVVIASFLGWMLDAFDFFLVVFVLKRIADDFGTDVKSVTYAIFLTLAMRPIGAFLFGRVADHFGRRPALMASVLLYSVMELASAFAPSLRAFLVLRALYGIAMGGEWGVGASLALESIPVRSRGMVSGMLQAGYPCGYLLASIVFGLLFDHIGWRGMFVVGAAPALLVLYIRSKVPESATWVASRAAPAARNLWSSLSGHWPLVFYAIALMTCFNFFSHGTQDLYPHFLETQRGFSTGTKSIIAIVYNIGAICGGIAVGTLSSRIGRRNAIALFDPKTAAIKKYPLPTKFGSPYDVVPTKDAAQVWTGSMVNDRVARLDTKSGQITEYLMPRPTNIRRVFVQETGPRPALWVGSNHGASIVKVEPLD